MTFQVMREGADVTLVAFGKMVGFNLQAAEILSEEGISCEVCHADALYLFPTGVDYL